MTNDNFMQAVRQYARLATRKHRSYAEAVHTLAVARAQTIDREAANEDERVQSHERLESFLQREYGKVDREFEVETYS